MLKFILDLIAPKKCYSCKKEGYFLCEDCLKKERDLPSECYFCKKTTPNFNLCDDCIQSYYFNKAIILTNYKDKLTSKLIKDAKFYNKKEIFEDFTTYLYDKFLLNHKIKFKDDYVIISIPSHFFRKLKRGYNSSEVLCKYFAKISGIKYEKNVLKKIKNVKQQSKLTREERLKNLEGVFALNKSKISKIKGKNIIILDDVISTGTTLNEASKQLKQAGVKSIIGIIIASG